MSYQNYFNIDPQPGNNVDLTLKCWLGNQAIVCTGIAFPSLLLSPPSPLNLQTVQASFFSPFFHELPLKIGFFNEPAY